MGGLLLLLLLKVVVLSAVVMSVCSGYRAGLPFKVRGKVYCDTCRFGFETNVTTYIQGATVRIECVDRDSLQVKYSVVGMSRFGGEYEMNIEGDRGDDICEAILVSSPMDDCNQVDSRRGRASIILTRSNGLSSDIRYVNNMGFLQKQDLLLPICSHMLQEYNLNTYY